MRHLLIGLLISYKKYRKFLEYHGNINQTSIVGIDNPNSRLYPNNTRGDYYDKDGRLKNVQTGKTSGQQHLDMDLYDYKYRLIYSHVNMLMVKQWLDLRTTGLERKARWTDQDFNGAQPHFQVQAVPEQEKAGQNQERPA